MLGKEDVLLWFKDLESYKRIEVMYELLNMCIPFEIRFLGSCIEEIGKHTYQELRGPSIIANDTERLTKDASLQAGLADQHTRHRAIIYMSVMSARNCTCANWYYRTLLRPADPEEHVVNVLSAKGQNISNVISELLLFYTLGLHHPAFTFAQKSHFRESLDALIRHCHATNGRNAGTATAASVCGLPGIGMTSDAAVVPVPVVRNVPSHIEDNQPVVPAVMTQPVIPVDPILMPPPGLPQNFLFPSGPPEARPFPAQTNKHAPSAPPRREMSPPQSPLFIAQSPCQMLPPAPISLLEPVAVPPHLHLDSNVMSPGPPPISYVPPPETLTKNIEENHFISEEKREIPWPPNEQIAKQNGIRFPKNYYPPHEQFGSLKIEPDKQSMTLCSNSNSSSSSRNQSPIETPSVTPAVTPHGPGRGLQQQQQPPQPQPPDAKPRVNGMPPPSMRLITSQTPCDQPPPRLLASQPQCDQPPPPYSNVPSYPGFPASVPHPPRNPNCCNCGGLGHTGIDCTSQSVEDITQTPYTLDFDSPTMPDPPEK